ncbi:unnamed protein product [Lathyrus oleraceus]
MMDTKYSDSSLPLDSLDNESSTIGESFEIDMRRNQNDDDDDGEGSEKEEEDDLIEINILRSLDFIFKQQGLMDLLEEVNEDESLIEIDIIKGFVKYQDFRFKESTCLGD